MVEEHKVFNTRSCWRTPHQVYWDTAHWHLAIGSTLSRPAFRQFGRTLLPQDDVLSGDGQQYVMCSLTTHDFMFTTSSWMIMDEGMTFGHTRATIHSRILMMSTRDLSIAIPRVEYY
jgi:hypothetical protein